MHRLFTRRAVRNCPVAPVSFPPPEEMQVSTPLGNVGGFFLDFSDVGASDVLSLVVSFVACVRCDPRSVKNARMALHLTSRFTLPYDAVVTSGVSVGSLQFLKKVEASSRPKRQLPSISMTGSGQPFRQLRVESASSIPSPTDVRSTSHAGWRPQSLFVVACHPTIYI